jgi:Transglutaminase-like superfamily
MKDERLTSLLSLLDDDNDRNACRVMIELLQYGDALEKHLRKLHESNNPQTRRRVHQLQAIMSFRRQRVDFARKLKNGRIGLFDGLIESHLLWYDSDTREEIIEVWHKLIDTADKFAPENIEKLAYFMRRSGFVVSDRDDFQADCFCLGIVIEDKVGADFILCAIAAEIAKKWNFELKLIRRDDRFALLSADGKVLLPQDGWQISEPKEFASFLTWTAAKLIKLVLSNLFLVAVESDSFRYLSIIGKCLAMAGGEEDTSFLPFPYAGDKKQ